MFWLYMQNLPVFLQAVRDVFAVSGDLTSVLDHPLSLDLPPTSCHAPLRPTASRRVIGGALDVGVVSGLVREEVIKAGLVGTEAWLSKVEQLLVMTRLKHGKQTLRAFNLC